jgi:bacterioferritin-associated ferredoxin
MVLIFNLKTPIIKGMLICHCHGVAEKRIRQIARRSGPSLRAVARECGAGTGCGGCRSAIRQILADEQEERSELEPSQPRAAAATLSL